MKLKNLKIILGIVAAILLIPLIAMQFSDEWNWGIMDFVVMGILLFVTGIAIDFAIRKISKPLYKILACAVIVLALLVVWVELATGGVSRTLFGGSDIIKTSEGKLKVANFSGPLQEVNEACYADGECYVIVDGKHITVIMGWSREIVGSVQGVESFGDLTKHIGKMIEVYARDNMDGTYTLYGSEGFYIKLK